MIGVSLNGIFPQGVPAIAKLMDNVRRVERLGFDAIWSGDHIIMHSPILDVMTVLASFAAITERVHIGTAVYLLPLRHPVATAKQVASLDVLSGGRFIFGVGVGGEIAREFVAVGVPVSERGRRTDEGLEILTRVLSQDHVTYEGRCYQIHDVTLEPRPQQQPYPPIPRRRFRLLQPPCSALPRAGSAIWSAVVREALHQTVATPLPTAVTLLISRRYAFPAGTMKTLNRWPSPTLTLL
jgi:hypothetical protein